MSDVHNIYEYAYAKKMTTEIPKIIEMLENMQSELYKYMEYRPISVLKWNITEILIDLECSYHIYKKIYDSKGKSSGTN